MHFNDYDKADGWFLDELNQIHQLEHPPTLEQKGGGVVIGPQPGWAGAIGFGMRKDMTWW